MSIAALGARGLGTPGRQRLRRAAGALLVGIGLNAALLALLLLTGRPALWSPPAAPETAIRLDLFPDRLRAPPAPLASAPRIVQPIASKPDRARPTPLTPPIPAQPVVERPVPPAPISAPGPANPAPPAPDEAAADRARTGAALRAMSACSRLGAPGGGEDRAECARQLAVHREEQIDVVPTQMRTQQAVADARRAYVESGAAAALLPKDKMTVHTHGMDVSIHYKCTMKFGAGEAAKMHCPGVN